jgi:hypothetical protein
MDGSPASCRLPPRSPLHLHPPVPLITQGRWVGKGAGFPAGSPRRSPPPLVVFCSRTSMSTGGGTGAPRRMKPPHRPRTRSWGMGCLQAVPACIAAWRETALLVAWEAGGYFQPFCALLEGQNSRKMFAGVSAAPVRELRVPQRPSDVAGGGPPLAGVPVPLGKSLGMTSTFLKGEALATFLRESAALVRGLRDPQRPSDAAGGDYRLRKSPSP